MLLKIFWAPSEDKYALKCPPGGQAFSNDLRLFCNDLTWKPKEKLWVFDEDSLRDVIDLCITHFGKKPEIDYKPQQQQKASSEIEINEANAAALNMFKAAGYEASKKVYSMLIMAHHPDKGGDRHKAAAITTGWREIKKALGW